MKQKGIPRSGLEPDTGFARRIFWISLAALAGLMVLAAALTVEHWLVLVPSFERAMEDLFSPAALLALGCVIALIVFGFVFLGSLRERSRQASGKSISRNRGRFLLGVFGAFALGIAGTGYLLDHDLRTAFRDERFSQQAGIARLKAQYIDQWVAERAIDLGFLVTSLKGLPFGQIDAGPELRQFVELMLYQVLIGHPERREYMLFTADGKMLVEVGGAPGHKDPSDLNDLVREAARDGKLKIGPLRLDSEVPPNPSMAFAQPFSTGGAASENFVVVLVVDPSVDLFKELEKWPSDSPTSEVLVVRRDGDDALYLVPPRLGERPVPAVGFRLPLSTPNLLAAAAIREGNGVRAALDYRGERVLAASYAAKSIPWIVIAKSDCREVMAPMNRRSEKIALVFGATILVGGFMVWSLWRSQQAETHELAVSNLRFVHAVQDMFIVVDGNNRILETNEAAQKAVGYSAEELRGMNARDLRLTDGTEEHGQGEALLSVPGGRVEVRTLVRRKDGSTFPAEVRVSAFELDGRIYRQAIGVDITDRVKLEQQVLRLARVKRSLQAATSILLRARSQAEIFDQICTALVEFGDYRMVSVAVPTDDPADRVRFPAVAGHDDGYLARARMIVNADPTITGPPIIAIKTGTVQVNQDFETNPATLPLREEALRRGYRSSIALPLRCHDVVVAALSIYAAEPKAFDAEEVQLLTGLADDISYALCRIASMPGTEG
jgi:PAS domain S-box-containing protein